MSLEDILTALEFSMDDRLDEIGDDLLRTQGVEDVLTTYFSERDVRPELMEVITLRGVMNNFLNLSLEDREGVEEFRQENPGYLEGEGNEKNIYRELSDDGNRFIREQRWIPSLLEFFDFYLENRVAGEVFGPGYIVENQKLKDQFGPKPKNLYHRAQRFFSNSDKLGHLIDLAVLSRPDLKQYTTKAGLLEVDGTRELITYFDFYLENRVDGEIFWTGYLQNNEKLKKQFGSKPNSLDAKVRRHFNELDNLGHLIDLAIKVRPDLEQYTTRSGLLEIDGPSELLTYFDFYLANRVDGEIFGPGYLAKNEKLKAKFGSKPKNLDHNMKKHFPNSGRLSHLISLAVKVRPDFEQYTTRSGLLEVDGPSELLTYFDFYLANRVAGEIFNANYLASNKKLKSQFSSKPKNLYQKVIRNFPESGRMDHIVRLASEKRPEILEYWRNGALKPNGGYEE